MILKIQFNGMSIYILQNDLLLTKSEHVNLHDGSGVLWGQLCLSSVKQDKQATTKTYICLEQHDRYMSGSKTKHTVGVRLITRHVQTSVSNSGACCQH